jgi:hypothetical protein
VWQIQTKKRRKARAMSKGQIKSAVSRKRAAGNVGPKPTNVKTIVKKKTRKKNKR